MLRGVEAFVVHVYSCGADELPVGPAAPPRKTPQTKKSRPLSSAGALRSQDSPQMTSWQVRCIAGTPRKHKKYLSRPFSGQRCGSYQKPDCSDWIQNFSRRLRPFRDHIALGRSALGEKEIEGLGLKFDPKPAETCTKAKRSTFRPVTPLTSCIMYHASCIMYHVSCIMHHCESSQPSYEPSSLDIM